MLVIHLDIMTLRSRFQGDSLGEILGTAFVESSHALRGEDKKFKLADQLTVPMYIPAQWKLFYPHLWRARATVVDYQTIAITSTRHCSAAGCPAKAHLTTTRVSTSRDIQAKKKTRLLHLASD